MPHRREAKSSPIAWTTRALSEPSPSCAGQFSALRSLPSSTNCTPGLAIASRRTTSVIAAASARSVLRNLSRAGVRAKRSRTVTIVPWFIASGTGALVSP
jgi:hypothetical protein